MKLSKIAFTVAAVLLAQNAVADEEQVKTKSEQAPDAEIERYAVVSSRIEIPLRQLATSVAVLDDADLLTRGFANLADALRIAPSVTVARSGGLGSPTTLRIRGEEGFRTQVRIDDVNIADPTGVQFIPQLDHIQSANISRVEVLRGSQGLVYGADAGGIVNITSRQYDEPVAGRLFAEYGRYDTTNLTADVGGKQDALNYYVSAQRLDTRGFNARIDDVSGDNDGYENQTFHTRLGYAFNEQLSLSVVARNTSGEGEFDNCFTAAFSRSDDCDSDFEQTNFRTALHYSDDKGQHSIAYNKTLIDREFLTEGVSAFLTKGHSERLEYVGNTQGSDSHNWVYGADWQQDAITQGDISNRTNRGVFGEYQGHWGDSLFVTLGGRYDDNEDFGEHVSYRFSAAKIWQHADYEIKLRSSYGTGFRAPSLFELAYNQGPFSFAPAAVTNLEEEQSEGFEIALATFDKDTFNVEVVYFNQRIKDAIFFDLATFSGYLQDPGQSRSEGVEVIAEYQLTKGLQLNGNYTYNDARDTADNRRIGRPRHLANVGIQYAAEDFQIAANLRVSADVVDIVGELDDYEVLDVTAQYFASEQFTLYGRLENALDSDYIEVGGFNTPGQALNFGLSYSF